MSVIAYLLGAPTVPIAVTLVSRAVEVLMLKPWRERVQFRRLHHGQPIPGSSDRTDKMVDRSYAKVVDLAPARQPRPDWIMVKLNDVAPRSLSWGPLIRFLNHPPREFDSIDILAVLREQVAFEAFSDDVLDRLLFQEKDIYAESDRHRSEAEMRLAVVLPGLLLVVGIWVGIELPLIADAGATIGLLCLLVMVSLDGVRRLHRSRDMVGFAVSEGVITTPTLDLLNNLSEAEDTIDANSIHEAQLPWESEDPDQLG